MKQLKMIAQTIKEAGGKCYLVGGYVRDLVIGKPSQDMDVEIYNLTPVQLEETLARFGIVKAVGKSFGVYKVRGMEIEFVLPRKEVKTGTGHKDFAVTIAPRITPQEAVRGGLL